MIEMGGPHRSDSLIVPEPFLGGRHLNEILVLDPADGRRIEAQHLGAEGLRVIELRIHPIADPRIQTSVHEDEGARLRASERNDRRIVESDGERLIPSEAGRWVHDHRR